MSTYEPAVKLAIDVEDVLLVLLVFVHQTTVQSLPSLSEGPHPVPLLDGGGASGGQDHRPAAVWRVLSVITPYSSHQRSIPPPPPPYL